ncbi:MAG: hypothetical protein R3Y47_07330 [Lachnospiraceae bacterium]
MIIFGVSLLLTSEFGRYIKLREYLEKSNIQCKVKTIDPNARWVGGKTMGTTRGMSVGTSSTDSLMYELIVSKRDLDEAKHIMIKNNL